MIVRVVLSIALAVASSQAAAKDPDAPFKRILSSDLQICGTAAIRPSLGNYPACVPSISNEDLGRVRAVWLSADNAVASTSPKAPQITAGGQALVNLRDNSTSAPPACTTVNQSPPCFTYDKGLDTVHTCSFPDAPPSRRGQFVGSNLAAEVAAIRQSAAAQRPTGPPPIVILAYRFDLVTWPQMQIVGFDPSWLVSTGTPWSQFQSWINNDKSDACTTKNADCSGAGIGKNGAKVACCIGSNPNPANFCTGTCSWTWSDRGWSESWDGRDLGIRLNDEIQALGRDPRTVTYYLTRPPSQKINPNAAVVREDSPAYQDWIVAQVKRLLAETRADMIHLNHKLFQYDPGTNRGSFYVGDLYPSVTAMTAAGDGGFSGNQAAAGYRMAQYVAGWRALATKLHQQGIKYQVWFNGYVWLNDTVFDDPGTPGVNENAIIRSVVYEADLVFVSRQGPWQKLVSELDARSVPYILLDEGCASP